MSELETSLRGAREAAGMSLGRMADLIHYSKGYLSLVETGRRPAASDVVASYERVLGVGGLGDTVNRRQFLSVTALVAVNAKLVTELTASLAGADPGPLAAVQTSYGVDRAIASVVDRGTMKILSRWASGGSDPVTRVNASGILAKVPGQGESARVVSVLRNDSQVQVLYLTAVVARVCSLEWAIAQAVVETPSRFPHPELAAERFSREVVNPVDAGARWCSAEMLQRLSPLIGR